MKDAVGRRLYHFAHCNMRLRHRYGIEMTLEEFDALSALFRQRKVPDTRTDSLGNVEGWVKLRDTWVCVSYRPGLQMIGTVMPAPPPAVFAEVMEQAKTRAPAPPPPQKEPKEPKEDKIKRAARLLMEQAMEAGKKPKWLREPGEIPVPVVATSTVPPQVKLVDVAWYKCKIGIAGDLLKKGKTLEAALLLRAVAGLPRSARPGQAPQEAERLVEADMAHERENFTQRFMEQQLTIRTPDDTTSP